MTENQSVGEMPLGRRSLEVGTLSPDGSRRWDGKFWVLIRNDYSLPDLPPPAVRPLEWEFSYERRGYRLGSVVLAAVVGLALNAILLSIPYPGSLSAALTELAIITAVRYVVTPALIVVILSIGRQGIDVLVLRAMLTAFLIGAALMGLLIASVSSVPIPAPVSIPWPLAVIAAGLILAFTLGPLLAAFAALANLLWYQSFKSLRPQLRIFNRIPRSA